MNICVYSFRPVEEIDLEAWLAEARQLIGRVQNPTPPHANRVQNPSLHQFTGAQNPTPPYAIRVQNHSPLHVNRVQNPSPPEHKNVQNPSPPHSVRVQKKPSPFSFHTVHVNNKTVAAITIR